MLFTNIIRLKEVDSTNNFARELLRKMNIDNNEPINGTVIISERQTAGRGQMQNKWLSNPSENLTFSLVIFPKSLPVEKQFYISKAISLGIYDFLNAYVSDCKVKWPNDILVGKSKIGGVLIENIIRGNYFSYSIIGIGFNVNQVVFPEKIGNPTSLALLQGKPFDLEEIFQNLILCLSSRYQQLENGAFDRLDEDYLNSLFAYNKPNTFSEQGILFMARIRGVDQFGRLLLEKEDGAITCYGFKEVSFVY